MNKMKKLLALLLAVVMVIGMFPMSAAAEGEEPVTCAVCGSGEHTEHPAETPAENQPPVDNCEDCDDETCAGCDGIMQLSEVDEEEDENNIEEDPQPCGTCGKTDCTSDHQTWCASCQVDNCGKTHTPDAGQEGKSGDEPGTEDPQPCGTCGKTDCTSEHLTWCASCQVDDCGKTHTPDGGEEDKSGDDQLCDCGLRKDHDGDCQETEPEKCECGAVEGEDHAEDCPNRPCSDCDEVSCVCVICKICGGKDCEPHSVPVYDQLKATESVEDMYILVLQYVQKDLDTLKALTEEEILDLLAYIEEIATDADRETDDYDDLRDTLTYLPAMECPECHQFGGHLPECPRNIEILPTGEVGNYVYLDLSAGSIYIEGDEYSGNLYVNGELTPVNGTGAGSKKFYIFQSGGNRAYGIQNGAINLPKYNRFQTTGGKKWNEYITNNSSVENVIGAWDDAATTNGRTPTNNFIRIVGVKHKWIDPIRYSGIGKRIFTEAEIALGYSTNYWEIISCAFLGAYNYDITLDNIYTTYHEGAGGRMTGGLVYIPDHNKQTAQSATIRLVGDNRFGNIFYTNYFGFTQDLHNPYANYSGTEPNLKYPQELKEYFLNGGFDNARIIFTDERANGESKDSTATLTVATYDKNSSVGHLCSAIGASDTGSTSDCSKGIVINGGTIFAGTTVLQNSTAIGGGGNGRGDVYINGGTVTAVSSSAGTAIGGGIGKGAYGGDAYVKITGGTVYAYNYGPYYSSDAYYAPAAAIGGGSSEGMFANRKSEVVITGGTVYAQSYGGVGIGGGGCVSKTVLNGKGGDCTVTISGGNVTAVSLPVPGRSHKIGVMNYYTQTNGELFESINYTGKDLPASVGIGGGSGRAGGGSAIVNITGGTVKTGSIGGGKYILEGHDYKIGSADVNISNGTVQGQVIMASGAEKDCTFSMTGGTIDNKDRDKSKFIFLQDNGGAVWLQNGTATMSGGTIQNCSAPQGGAIYVDGGSFTMNGSARLQGNQATNNGGAVYVNTGNAYINGGTIDGGNTSTTSVNNAVNGGAVYVHGGIFQMTDGTIQKNKTTQDGAAVYVEGGTCNLYNGTIAENSAMRNGGGVYVVNTGVTFGQTGKTITISGNHAVNGAGLYISQTSANTNSTETAQNYVTHIANGQIINNVASGNGGGIYQTGNYGYCEVLGSGVISENQAKNGGGLYIANGSELKVVSGVISMNEALKPANVAAIETAYTDENNVGVGGGIYVAKGADADLSKFEMGKTDTNGNVVGIYGNLADCAADDVYANATWTDLELPDVANMELSEDFAATGWYEDYAENDTHYADGTKQNDNYNKGIHRYREAMRINADTFQVEVTDANKSNKYICLTIGITNIGTGVLTVTKAGEDVQEDEVFIFNIKSKEMNSSTVDQNIEFSVKIVGTGTITIKNVPHGTYEIEEVAHWRYQALSKQEVTISPENVNGGCTFTNVRKNDKWLDGYAEPAVNVFTVAGGNANG